MSKFFVIQPINYQIYRVFVFRVVTTIVFSIAIYGCGGHVYHVVEPGETLYSIGWLYGYDYRQIAQWNNVDKPYLILRGQRLRVAPTEQEKKSIKPDATNTKSVTIATKGLNQSAVNSKHKHSHKENRNKQARDKQARDKEKRNKENHRATPRFQTDNKHNKSIKWSWPTRGGTIIHSFDRSDPTRKGLDLAGKSGQPVYAASSGRVVYSGSGIGRYGKLIIVKHNETYLSAYAHNKRLLVKEGDVLRASQQIAEMGGSGTNRVKLHFEIRRNGKPVDPLRYLPKKKR